jgi:hypothetical protein
VGGQVLHAAGVDAADPAGGSSGRIQIAMEVVDGQQLDVDQPRAGRRPGSPAGRPNHDQQQRHGGDHREQPSTHSSLLRNVLGDRRDVATGPHANRA